MSDHTISADDAPTCTMCSERITDLPTDRVIANVVDGDVEYTHFCSASCESEYHT